jgi:hypothetical protein
VNAQEKYAFAVEAFLIDMAIIEATQEEYYDGLRHALHEIEVALQACKETM